MRLQGRGGGHGQAHVVAGADGTHRGDLNQADPHLSPSVCVAPLGEQSWWGTGEIGGKRRCAGPARGIGDP